MMKVIARLLLCVLGWASAAQASLVIEVTRGVDNPTPIAIVPFAWSGSGYLSENVPAIVSADLRRCGQFDPLAEKDMPLSLPSKQADIVYSDWRKYGIVQHRGCNVAQTAAGQRAAPACAVSIAGGEELWLWRLQWRHTA